jgi:hypothetical protein
MTGRPRPPKSEDGAPVSENPEAKKGAPFHRPNPKGEAAPRRLRALRYFEQLSLTIFKWVTVM